MLNVIPEFPVLLETPLPAPDTGGLKPPPAGSMIGGSAGLDPPPLGSMIGGESGGRLVTSCKRIAGAGPTVSGLGLSAACPLEICIQYCTDEASSSDQP